MAGSGSTTDRLRQSSQTEVPPVSIDLLSQSAGIRKCLNIQLLPGADLFTGGAVYMILLTTWCCCKVESDMKTFVYGFAYLLIYTTPIQVLFLLWVAVLIATTDHSWLSLSTGIFLRDNIPFLYHWLYSWFWNAANSVFMELSASVNAAACVTSAHLAPHRPEC
jgi:hypothetical protein